MVLRYEEQSVKLHDVPSKAEEGACTPLLPSVGVLYRYTCVRRSSTAAACAPTSPTVLFVTTKHSSPPFLSSTLSTLRASSTVELTLRGDGEKVNDPPTHMRVLNTSGGGDARGNEVDPSGESSRSETVGGKRITVGAYDISPSEHQSRSET